MPMKNIHNLKLAQGLQTFFQRDLPTPDTPSPSLTFDCATAASMAPTRLPTPSASASPVSPRVFVEDDEEEDADYDFDFEAYVPLSMLPTPPMSDKEAPAVTESEVGVDAGLDVEFYAPAKFLATMVPVAAEDGLVTRLQRTLQRAGMREEVVALAGCLLDCASDKFVRSWRSEVRDIERRAEVLAVAALALGMKYLEDTSYTLSYWAFKLCEPPLPQTALTATERLLLADLEYRLFTLCSSANIDWNLAEIDRLRPQAAEEERDAGAEFACFRAQEYDCRTGLSYRAYNAEASSEFAVFEKMAAVEVGVEVR